MPHAVLMLLALLRGAGAWSAPADAGVFANARRGRLYNFSSQFCDDVLPKFHDSFLVTLELTDCSYVERIVRTAFDAWAHNTDLSFYHTEGDADLVLSSEALVAESYSGTARAKRLGYAVVPHRLSRLDEPIPIVLSTSSCWYSDRWFCDAVRTHYVLASIGLACAWAFSLLYLLRHIVRRPPASSLQTVARLVAWVLIIAGPLVVLSALPCLQCYDFESVVTHEIGHALGLDHSDTAEHCGCNATLRAGSSECEDESNIMNAKFRATPTLCLGADDIDGVRALWGSPCEREHVCYLPEHNALLFQLALAVVYAFAAATLAVALRAACYRACDACRAAGLGVKACLVDKRHAAGVAPRGFAKFCAEVRAAPAYREPDGPPSEGAVCAAVQAAVSGVAVPAHFVDAVKEFANRESKLTTVIQGGRRSVYVDGGEAGPFRDFADGAALSKGERRVSRRTNATKFLERCRCAIAYRAAYLWPRSHAIHLSADMLCLVGAPAAQVPHVDLIPDQCQAVMALTRQAPTLVLRKDASPSIEEAFAKVGIDAGSTTKWADLVRAAPALALGRDEINRGMVDATRYLDPPPTDEEVAAAAQAAQGRRRRSTAGAGGVDGDCRPVSRDAWDAGSLFLADHRLVHAGPRCTQPGPRVVLFTTFTVQSTEAEAATYDPRDQYMPYFLAEDPSMSDEKAAALLHHWREEKPWDHYPDTDQSLAVKLLATRGPELSEEKRRDAVARMRATPPE